MKKKEQGKQNIKTESNFIEDSGFHNLLTKTQQWMIQKVFK